MRAEAWDSDLGGVARPGEAGLAARGGSGADSPQGLPQRPGRFPQRL